MNNNLQVCNPVSKDKWYKRFFEYLLHEKKILDFTTNTAKCINSTKRLTFPDFYYVAMLLFPGPVFITSVHVLRFLVMLLNIPHIKHFDIIISITCEIFMFIIFMKIIRCVIFSVCKWQEIKETHYTDEMYKFEYFLQEKAKKFRRYYRMSFVFACCTVIGTGMLLQ